MASIFTRNHVDSDPSMDEDDIISKDDIQKVAKIFKQIAKIRVDNDSIASRPMRRLIDDRMTNLHNYMNRLLALLTQQED
jgi:hypothetical protein